MPSLSTASSERAARAKWALYLPALGRNLSWSKTCHETYMTRVTSIGGRSFTGSPKPAPSPRFSFVGVARRETPLCIRSGKTHSVRTHTAMAPTMDQIGSMEMPSPLNSKEFNLTEIDKRDVGYARRPACPLCFPADEAGVLFLISRL